MMVDTLGFSRAKRLKPVADEVHDRQRLALMADLKLNHPQNGGPPISRIGAVVDMPTALYNVALNNEEEPRVVAGATAAFVHIQAIADAELG